ncbi:hypothetical protein LWF15_32460 [Kineosporia rhizophila]|uniref:hypothetical protein n=1 Tax=Kineosporia rhizophila TaxID=84633 RepID=UPI000ACAD95D|nr:hypothetical protein [Kineosporia rhizophila]MCE0540217.1 hypothetical protein [Kineosporia rhizophila]
MRRILIATGLAATLALGGATAAEAAPKNKPCVTLKEFGKVDVGMSKAKVAKIFGTKGTRESLGEESHGYTQEVRSYKVCKEPTAVVEVTFHSGDKLPSTKVGWTFRKVWTEQWTQ